MSDGSELSSALVGGAVVTVGHVFTLLRGHFAVRRELTAQRRLIELLCERLGVDIASGPHLIDRKKT